MMNFIKVEAGSYEINTTRDFLKDMPNKQMTVTVNDFYIMDFVVEQADWVKTLSKNPSFFKDDSLPVESITWYDAINFCNKRSIDDGLQPCYEIVNGNVSCDFKNHGYRLPTEAEWEYAAKGGKNGNQYKYAGGDDPDEVAWYAKNANRMTHPKGQKKANELGIYDMSGNVFEWCWDWFAKYDKTYADNPKGAISGNKRVVRGNCWVNGITTIYLSRRVSRSPNSCNHHLGVRLVKTL